MAKKEKDNEKGKSSTDKLSGSIFDAIYGYATGGGGEESPGTPHSLSDTGALGPLTPTSPFGGDE